MAIIHTYVSHYQRVSSATEVAKTSRGLRIQWLDHLDPPAVVSGSQHWTRNTLPFSLDKICATTLETEKIL